jgi:N-acyl-D-amino-acid deacylase
MNRLAQSALLVLLFAACAAGGERAFEERVRDAAGRGLKVVERGAREYPTHRKCFSCHHQTLPLFAHVAARDAGLEVDGTLVAEQREFTARHFEKSREKLVMGARIGGGATTVTYGLWALEAIGDARGDLQRDMVEFLLHTQRDDGSWSPSSSRPPMMQSHVTMTTLALLGFETYGTVEQRERIEAATERAREFLAKMEPVTQEDRTSRLWGLVLLGADESELAAARRAVLDAQRDDGGFAPEDELQSDAYATGQTLWVLRYADVKSSDPQLRRAAEFLLRTQEEGGCWHVVTRAKPVQVYFDNGDPHGRDQFITIPATAWAVAGLASLLDPPAATSP